MSAPTGQGDALAAQIAWDDCRIVLEVARSGNLSNAARALGVNHTTVMRRIDALEARLGTALFERSGARQAPTRAGERIRDAALAMERAAERLMHDLAGGHAPLLGSIRIQSTESLLTHLLMPILAEFADAHRGLSLELSTAAAAGGMLTRRGADVAVLIAHEIPAPLVGRACGVVQWATYAAAGLTVDDRTPWIGFDDSLARTGPAEWLRRNVAPARVGLRADSLSGVAEAVRHALGCALLPVFMGEAVGMRLSPPVEGLDARLYIVTHADLRELPRIAALLEYVASRLAADARLQLR